MRWRRGRLASHKVLSSFCLCLIVVQNSSLILVTSYSRTLTPAYLPSVAVFFAELVKVVAAVLLLGAFSMTAAGLERVGGMAGLMAGPAAKGAAGFHAAAWDATSPHN